MNHPAARRPTNRAYVTSLRRSTLTQLAPRVHAALPRGGERGAGDRRAGFVIRFRNENMPPLAESEEDNENTVPGVDAILPP